MSADMMEWKMDDAMEPPDEPVDIFVPPPAVWQARVDVDHVVTGLCHSNTRQDGWIDLTDEEAATIGQPGRHTLVDGVIADYAPPPEPAAPTICTKADIWRRTTDAEAEAMDGMLAGQPVRIRRIYEGCQDISSADELYPILETGLAQVFGAERAAELLAPSP